MSSDGARERAIEVLSQCAIAPFKMRDPRDAAALILDVLESAGIVVTWKDPPDGVLPDR